MAQITLNTKKYQFVIDSINKQTGCEFLPMNIQHHQSLMENGELDSSSTEWFYRYQSDSDSKTRSIIIKIIHLSGDDEDNIEMDITINRTTRNTFERFYKDEFNNLVKFIKKNK